MGFIINKNWIFGIVFFFSCLINFVLPLGNSPVPIALIFLYAAIAIILVSDNLSVLDFFKHRVLSRKSLFKPFVIFLVYVTISSVFFVLLGKVSVVKNLLPFVGGIVMQITAALLFSAYMTYKKLKIKTLMKIILAMVYFILIMGIVDFVVSLLDIKPLMDAVQIFANERTILPNGDLSNSGRAIAGSLARTQGLYIEPGGFASVIAFFMPMIYTFANTKFRIFSNNKVDIILKRTIVPIMWFDIIATQSPIYLVICTLITLVYFHKLFIENMKITISVLSGALFVIILYILFIDFDVSGTYLARILSVIESFGNFELFIHKEPSLATRVVNYFNTLDIWSKHPIFGVGLGALPEHMTQQILNSKLPLTIEIVLNYSRNSRFSFNTGFFYKYIAETGLIGITLFYYFIINSALKLKKLVKYIPVSAEKTLCLSLVYTVFSFCALSFYNIAYMSLFIWIIIGAVIGVFYKISDSLKTNIKSKEEEYKKR